MTQQEVTCRQVKETNGGRPKYAIIPSQRGSGSEAGDIIELKKSYIFQLQSLLGVITVLHKFKHLIQF